MPIKNIFSKLFTKPKKYNNNYKNWTQKIKNINVSRHDDYIFVNYEDGTKSRFPIKYRKILNKGKTISFQGIKNKQWINPSKNPSIKVYFEGKVEKLNGKLKIGYVSKLKNDNRGEYVYLPKCTYKDKTMNLKDINGNIYIDSLSEENEKDGVLQGYGTIEGSFKKMGNTIIVSAIDSFKPILKNKTYKFPLSKVHFSSRFIEFYSDEGSMYCSQDDVPFKISSDYNKILRDKLENKIVKVDAVVRKVGSVRRINEKWVESIYWVQHQESKWDFSNCNLADLFKAIEEVEMDEKYAKILEELKNLQSFKSFSSIKRKIKTTGRTITNEELHDIFFHPGYDKKAFSMLNNLAVETFVDNLSFIFKVKSDSGNVFYVWETPKRELATYIFNEQLSSSQLFARIKETPRMLIRKEPEIQTELGFEGFIIHSNPEVWQDKFNSFIKK